jgi:hypothetical protein
MVDFRAALHPQNIDKLIQEKGLFIAHTYFSVPMNYHVGKLIDKNGTVNEMVDKNFSYLSEKIQNNLIWNPTISELVLFLDNFENIKLEINQNGEFIFDEKIKVPFRIVN